MPAMVRALVALCASLVAFLAVAQTAAAQTDQARWTCRASALRVELAGDTLLEPVTANDKQENCGRDDATTPAVDQGTGGLADPLLPTIRVIADGAYARTDLLQAGGPTIRQTATAVAGAANAKVQIQSGGEDQLVIEIEGLTVKANGSCQGGAPSLQTASEAVTVRINGEVLTLNEAATEIANLLTQLGLDPLVKVEIAKVIEEGGPGDADQSATIRAIEVQLLGAPEPAADIVVGEARVDRHLGVCTPPPCPNGTIPNEQGQCVVIIQPPCPPGSTENDRGQCVVPENPDGTCPAGSLRNPQGQCVLIVTAPCPIGSFDNGQNQCVLIGFPTGGTVVPPGAVSERIARRCSRGAFGSQLAILGTNRADRITGTNRSDRIFALGGRDRVSGGRGNDCVEGGSGNDNLDGSNGADGLFGGSGRDIINGGTGRDTLAGDAGNDKLNGGSGNDRMNGGAGRDKLSGGLGVDRLNGGASRDYIEGGGGKDTIRAGSGNDAINSATAGSGRDIVDCGSGRDVVRIDPRDRVRNCERVLVLRQR